MNKSWFFLFVIIFLSASIACDDKPIKINEIIEIGYQESVQVPLANSEIQFAKVVQESRCPADVVCIHAGSVTVQLKVTSILNTPSDTTTFELILAGLDGEPTSDTLENIIYTLLAVNPYPIAESPVADEDKVVRLQVESF